MGRCACAKTHTFELAGERRLISVILVYNAIWIRNTLIERQHLHSYISSVYV